MIARGNDYHSLCFVKNFDVQSKIHKKQKENKNKRTAFTSKKKMQKSDLYITHQIKSISE
jgi:hypothetical protein